MWSLRIIQVEKRARPCKAVFHEYLEPPEAGRDREGAKGSDAALVLHFRSPEMWENQLQLC
jgi:hypothetical protein